MRFAVVLFALAAAAPLASTAQVATDFSQIPNDDAGEIAELGASLCGVPPSSVTEYKRKIDVLQPGTTQSAEFTQGVDRIRRAMAQLRANGDNMSEFRDTRCGTAIYQIRTVLVANTP